MSELDRLRWRCRRGTLELDLMLAGYLDNRYLDADDSERLAFLRLLDSEDSELLRYLTAEQTPGDADLSRVVTRIRGLA